MELTVGKTYVSSNGEIVKIKDVKNVIGYLHYVDIEGRVYNKSGINLTPFNHNFNLTREFNWYEQIPEEGTLCWFNDDEYAPKGICIIRALEYVDEDKGIIRTKAGDFYLEKFEPLDAGELEYIGVDDVGLFN